MLFTTVLSLLALVSLGQSAPAVELEDRGIKFKCVTKYSGKLSGKHNDKAFSFTKSGSSVTYSGDHPKSNVLNVEFQACTNTTSGSGKLMKDGGDWVGRLRVKKTNSCIELPHHKDGSGSLKIVSCNSKTLTVAQTWRYDTIQFGLFWGGWFYFGNTYSDDGSVCRSGYKAVDEGKPLVSSNKQVKLECGKDDVDNVRWWKLL